MGCVNVEISCDDMNEDTYDSCDGSTGCVHTAVHSGYSS
jgi:hypothetical protein